MTSPKISTHHRQHNGGDGGAPFRVQQIDKEDRAQRRGGDVHDVVADQDGGQELVILTYQCQHPRCLGVAAFGPGSSAGSRSERSKPSRKRRKKPERAISTTSAATIIILPSSIMDKSTQLSFDPIQQASGGPQASPGGTAWFMQFRSLRKGGKSNQKMCPPAPASGDGKHISMLS